LKEFVAGPDGVAAAAAALAGGQLAILPTDTVYGVAADIRNDDAVSSIYGAKRRAADFPLQLLFGRDATLIERYAVVNAAARKLVDALGPGAWTIVVAAREGWDSPALSGGRTVGFRVVPVDVTLDVLDRLGGPVAASSANVSGGASPTTCADAVAQLGESVAVAIDAGPTAKGLDSTVVDVSGDAPSILREGAIDRATVARILGLTEIPVVRSVRS
jgi:tRNA threonylcarbamoyl adenosine modification protein (Sua5/YciO/YrdC/YwlC family)